MFKNTSLSRDNFIIFCPLYAVLKKWLNGSNTSILSYQSTYIGLEEMRVIHRCKFTYMDWWSWLKNILENMLTKGKITAPYCTVYTVLRKKLSALHHPFVKAWEILMSFFNQVKWIFVLNQKSFNKQSPCRDVHMYACIFLIIMNKNDRIWFWKI